MAAENARLQAEVKRLEMRTQILKKAIADYRPSSVAFGPVETSRDLCVYRGEPRSLSGARLVRCPRCVGERLL
jgi:hypothetical protein